MHMHFLHECIYMAITVICAIFPPGLQFRPKYRIGDGKAEFMLTTFSVTLITALSPRDSPSLIILVRSKTEM